MYFGIYIIIILLYILINYNLLFYIIINTLKNLFYNYFYI